MKAKRSEPQGDTRPPLLTDTSGVDREAFAQMLSSLIRQPGASPDQPGIPLDEIMAVLEPMAEKAVNFVRSMDKALEGPLTSFRQGPLKNLQDALDGPINILRESMQGPLGGLQDRLSALLPEGGEMPEPEADSSDSPDSKSGEPIPSEGNFAEFPKSSDQAAASPGQLKSLTDQVQPVPESGSAPVSKHLSDAGSTASSGSAAPSGSAASSEFVAPSGSAGLAGAGASSISGAAPQSFSKALTDSSSMSGTAAPQASGAMPEAAQAPGSEFPSITSAPSASDSLSGVSRPGSATPSGNSFAGFGGKLNQMLSPDADVKEVSSRSGQPAAAPTRSLSGSSKALSTGASGTSKTMPDLAPALSDFSPKMGGAQKSQQNQGQGTAQLTSSGDTGFAPVSPGISPSVRSRSGAARATAGPSATPGRFPSVSAMAAPSDIPIPPEAAPTFAGSPDPAHPLRMLAEAYKSLSNFMADEKSGFLAAMGGRQALAGGVGDLRELLDSPARPTKRAWAAPPPEQKGEAAPSTKSAPAAGTASPGAGKQTVIPVFDQAFNMNAETDFDHRRRMDKYMHKLSAQIVRDMGNPVR